MGEMRGVGVKNREKSADVLCGRPLMPCPSIGSKLFWTHPNCFGQNQTVQNVKFSGEKLFLVC